MIEGYCTTNLDDYDVSCVKAFGSVPNIGEKVYCKYKGKESTLKVVQITHCMKTEGYAIMSYVPYIIVELNR